MPVTSRAILVALFLAYFLFAVPTLAQVPTLGPTDAIAFDYFDSDFTLYSVTHFEVSWDSGAFAVTAASAFVDGATQPGATSYRVAPPFSAGNHTVSFRVCNAWGCSLPTSPFAFGYASGSQPAQPPSNVRKVTL